MTQTEAPTLDRRTKRLADVAATSLADLLDDRRWGDDGRAELARRAQHALGLPPLALEVDGESATLHEGCVERGVRTGALRIVLDPAQLSELVAGTNTMYGLVFQSGVQLPDGAMGDLLAWEHPLRALVDGRPLYEPGTLSFTREDGSPLDLTRSFSPEDSDAEIARFLAEAGFLRLRGWIDPDVLDPISSEVEAAAAAATRDQPHRWWARLDDGTERCVRVMYVLDVSPTMARVVEGDAYRRLQMLFDDGHRRFPERAQSSEALIKPLNVVEGITEFPWHRDCSFGGHEFHCAGYAVGLPLSATDASAGQLRVVAGSHRVSVPPPGIVAGYESDLPVVELTTEPGDLTIHIGCVLHGTSAPRARPRTVVYTTFSLPELA